jgi:hypothetical protein
MLVPCSSTRHGIGVGCVPATLAGFSGFPSTQNDVTTSLGDTASTAALLVAPPSRDVAPASPSAPAATSVESTSATTSVPHPVQAIPDIDSC